MKPRDDPTIARIRETRHQISERFGHDPQKLIAYYVGLQKKYQDRVVGEAAEPAEAAKCAEQVRPAGLVREEDAIYTIQGEDVSWNELIRKVKEICSVH
jgi:restriction endonuclease Mrr